MCDHWYKQCEVCGARVHKGALCDCGNDLHSVIPRIEEERDASKARHLKAQSEVEIALEKYMERELCLNRLRTIQEERKTARNIQPLREALNGRAE